MEEVDQEASGILHRAKAVRELGVYFSVLGWLSENGLSLETCGRL
jgi:hypothetical protein